MFVTYQGEELVNNLHRYIVLHLLSCRRLLLMYFIEQKFNKHICTCNLDQLTLFTFTKTRLPKMSIDEQSKMQHYCKLAFFYFWWASLSFRSLGFFYSLAMEHLKPRMHHITEKVQAYLLGPGINLAQERMSKQSHVTIWKSVET